MNPWGKFCSRREFSETNGAAGKKNIGFLIHRMELAPNCFDKGTRRLTTSRGWDRASGLAVDGMLFGFLFSYQASVPSLRKAVMEDWSGREVLAAEYWVFPAYSKLVVEPRGLNACGIRWLVHWTAIQLWLPIPGFHGSPHLSWKNSAISCSKIWALQSFGERFASQTGEIWCCTIH